MTMQRVNMDIDRELWKEIGMKAIELDMHKKEIVEVASRNFLNNKEDNVMTKTYEGSYVFNVNISEEDNERIEQEVNRIYNMLNDQHNQKEINGLETLLYELELEVNENEDNAASIESVEYGKLNTDTGYNHFVVADVDIKTVEEYMVYSVNLSNVRTFKELA